MEISWQIRPVGLQVSDLAHQGLRSFHSILTLSKQLTKLETSIALLQAIREVHHSTDHGPLSGEGQTVTGNHSILEQNQANRKACTTGDRLLKSQSKYTIKFKLQSNPLLEGSFLTVLRVDFQKLSQVLTVYTGVRSLHASGREKKKMHQSKSNPLEEPFYQSLSF